MGRTSRRIEVKENIGAQVIKVLQKHGHDTTTLEEMRRRYSDLIELDLGGLSTAALEEIAKIDLGTARDNNLVKAYLRISKDPGAKFGPLEAFPEAFKRWMTVNSIDGWLYTHDRDTQLIAYAVVDAKFYPPIGSGDDYEPAYASVSLQCDTAWGSGTVSIHYSDRDATQATVEKLILGQGYLKETPELKAEYLRQMERFHQYRPQFGAQFVTGGVQHAPTKSKEYAYGGDYEVESTGSVNAGDRLVNDEETAKRQADVYKDNRPWKRYLDPVKPDEFTAVPLHPYLKFYDLRRYCEVWLHVNDVRPYVYDKTLGEKLVLPQHHRDLIDVLVEDMDVFKSDIIEGKSGGTAILNHGAPGLGKTLCAEVYAELIGRPLYKVHSGMLGTTAREVEKNLADILKRAERWKCVTLLDECDVFVAKRGGDLDKNAVVAGFLRTLEYFNGLLFLTTNRIEDVDDAILSRMIALFHFEAPDAEMSHRLWTILAANYGIVLTEKHTAALIRQFPGISGRDIKQLLRLVQKYTARKGVKLSMEAFRICAMFRGVDTTKLQAAPKRELHSELAKLFPRTGTLCGVDGCGLPQFETPAGVTCDNGHGGAPELPAY